MASYQKRKRKNRRPSTKPRRRKSKYSRGDKRAYWIGYGIALERTKIYDRDKDVYNHLGVDVMNKAPTGSLANGYVEGRNAPDNADAVIRKIYKK